MKTRRVNVRGIIFNDGKLLVTKFREQDGGSSSHWGTFGGGLDAEEDMIEGLHREMIEETGIAPEIGKLLFIQQFSNDEKEFLEFFFEIKNVDDYEIVDLEATSHGALELTEWAYLDPKAHNVLPKFLQTIDIAAAIAEDKPVFIYSELA